MRFGSRMDIDEDDLLANSGGVGDLDMFSGAMAFIPRLSNNRSQQGCRCIPLKNYRSHDTELK